MHNELKKMMNFVIPLAIQIASDFCSVLSKVTVFSPYTELTADHKGPLGSAYAFSKPKAQAVKISNSSFILQFASVRFVNNFLSE